MSYQVLIQPPAFGEIETTYRWMCDYLSADAANQWYYDIQDAIASLQEFPYRCSVAPEAAIIGREIRQLWVVDILPGVNARGFFTLHRDVPQVVLPSLCVHLESWQCPIPT
ncbi:hypothetical protein [Microcoleus sp. EPA2]|uniref:type II toxin-antitoxin system RelE/ParE family toxin n=1 Tax=Microcoleus sp. EPA2 TaxID=2841654 RepID=UPI00312B851E